MLQSVREYNWEKWITICLGEWDQQVYNKYGEEKTEEKNDNDEFDWSKAPEDSKQFTDEMPTMYNRSASLPENSNNENEISLIWWLEIGV